MKYATFDGLGLPVGFFSEDVQGPRVGIDGTPNSAYPAGVVEITDAQWQVFIDNPGARRWDGTDVAVYMPPPPPVVVPDNPTLSDWRVALTLWKRDDGTLRIDEVTAQVGGLVAAGQPLGRIARERLEYANNVLRAQLLQLADALGFTAAEIDESLWRADRVRQGDLTGTWPLPSA